MTFKMSTADHRAMDKHLNATLEAYKKGTLSLSQARSSLAHFITAAAIGNEGEFKKYIRLKLEDIFDDD